jgi:hypothetical protein
LAQDTLLRIVRDICEVMKRQHQNPAFGHTQGEIIKKTCQKSALAFKVGVKLRKRPIWCFPEFHPVLSSFPERLDCCSINFHWSYLYSYYDSSRTLCIKCWDSAFGTESFSISYWDLIKLPYFADTTKRGVRGRKEAQRQGENRVTLGLISLLSQVPIKQTGTPKLVDTSVDTSVDIKSRPIYI